MRDRLALVGAVGAVLLVLAFSQSSGAQQERRRPAGEQTQNPTAGQERNQRTAAAETIRGIVAAVTAEGEAMFDYRSNRAVAAEGAFLTVVGSPIKSEERTRERPATTENERQGTSSKKRHNVYIVWMTPRTKVCELEKSGQTQAETGAGKREVGFDQLEVGDHVEIQFSKSEESGANAGIHQTDRMRSKHGRHRTFVGYASAITILPENREHASGGFERKPRESSR
jgi:hypothetical protein